MLRAALAAMLLLAACSNTTQGPAPDPAEAGSKWTIYVCEDGRIVQARYPDSQTARVRVPEGERELRIAMSGSGARYVGQGLQWWTKGDEGMLAALSPGEDIASAPGVTCVPPGRAPVDPPAPGTPGGLPDDRTPIDERPPAPGSGQAAARVVETYFALVESGRDAEAAKLRRDGQLYDVKPFARLNAQIGGPRGLERADRAVQVRVPIVLFGRLETGEEYHASGRAVLRRVDGEPDWRIDRIEVETAPSAARPTG